MASTSVAKRSSATKKFPNWLEMPDELMENILQRLRTAEKLKSARKVCTTWRRICKDPAMWKVIDLSRLYDDRDKNYDIETLTKHAVHLSCGELIDISIWGFGNDDLLDFISLRSSKLTSLSLGECNYMITSSALIRAVKRLPQLEKLHVSNISFNAKDIEVIGRNCPRLNSFTMCKFNMVGPIGCNNNALAIANNMHELQHLEVIDNEMSNYGLEAILNGCPHLQYLDVQMCSNLDLDGNLGKLCMERIKDFKCDSTGYEWYDYECDCGCDFHIPGDSDSNVGYSEEYYEYLASIE